MSPRPAFETRAGYAVGPIAGCAGCAVSRFPFSREHSNVPSTSRRPWTAAGTAGAATPAGDSHTPPPAGWQSTDDDARKSTTELDPLVALVQAMRDLIPPELQRRLIAAFRELLLALRALIDWYLERVEHRRAQGVEVQDIPIL